MTFHRTLLRWYRTNQRRLPWRQAVSARRRKPDPYRILLSEFMLQQTQVQTVIPYYHRFLKKFPSFKALARAPLDGVLKAWEGLGYYSRARNLLALGKTVTQLHGGELPADYASLIALPGIGRYSAGAILSIAYDQRYAVVDGNVARVFARHFGIHQDIAQPSTREKIWQRAEKLLPRRDVGDYNQALMELGAMICTPKNPACDRCPVRRTCYANVHQFQSRLPVKRKAKATPHYHIGAGVIWHQGKILISQRPLDGLLGGLWEFPGGKQEKSESIRACIRREIKEELDIDVEVGRLIATVDHAYTHFKITLHAHHCIYRRGQPKAIGVRAWQWIKPEALRNFAFPAANQPIIASVVDPAPGKFRTVPADAE